MTGSEQRALLVEDDDFLRDLLTRELRDLDLEVVAVASAEEALACVSEVAPTLVVTDLRLPGIDGIALLDRVQGTFELNPMPPFVLITAFGTVDRAVEALKHGAADFLTKPLDLDHLRLRIQRLLEVEGLRRRVALQRDGSVDAPFHGIIGQSVAMCRLMDQVRHVARARGPVLIVGDSGVGKELVARAVHGESERRDGPFVPVNCASVPASLLESEFFGHEQGSFTGASRRRDGLFAAAEGGTILLDEVSELPIGLQAKLLRVLQEGSVRRVGATREVPIDVRVLAATNKDIEEEIEMGRFRTDLFFRLGAFALQVPSLAERGTDIELLTAYFLSAHRGSEGTRIDGVSSEVLQHLRGYPFPGNVRELENIVEHAVTFCGGTTIDLCDLPARVRDYDRGGRQQYRPIPSALLSDGGILTLEELANRYVSHVLELTNDNKRRAAKLLGISRQTLYRYVKSL
jgi:DNA-binding NtrC family response regulator